MNVADGFCWINAGCSRVCLIPTRGFLTNFRGFLKHPQKTQGTPLKLPAIAKNIKVKISSPTRVIAEFNLIAEQILLQLVNINLGRIELCRQGYGGELADITRASY